MVRRSAMDVCSVGLCGSIRNVYVNFEILNVVLFTPILTRRRHLDETRVVQNENGKKKKKNRYFLSKGNIISFTMFNLVIDSLFN